jgi:phosphatidylserine/phosphatidylglycerophosphate/cardiolipin synthase-like enzyme
MPVSVTKASASLSVRAYAGDAKTLLAFNLLDTSNVTNLAGFTIRCRPSGHEPYYLYNTLQFRSPGDHAQDPTEPAYSSINAPLHKFRWLHVPGSAHQGLTPFRGRYRYTVTPRYFDADHALLPLDPGLGVSVSIDVVPFRRLGLSVGFTRGFTQSQAFVHHFGLDARIRPEGGELLFDTSQIAGTDATGTQYSYADEYDWSGFTARERIYALLNDVVSDEALRLDVFAYDLNEPDLIEILLLLAGQGRIRIILDNAGLHHDVASPHAEDAFETLFRQRATGAAEIQRGRFGRYAHDKIFVVSQGDAAVRVLTGSTNFSVTGLYVNSNHVLVFDDPIVAARYARLFETVWAGKVSLSAFLASELAATSYAFSGPKTPPTEVTFAPHAEGFATATLEALAARIQQEGQKATGDGSVLFAVMSIDQGTSPVYTALTDLHSNERIFSFGISDSASGISLYTPGRKTGVLVTGKPVRTQLPPPFNQVRNIGGVGHQVHHKFVVCGFNGEDPVVFCGSSNLALGGEQLNGDNLLAIRDPYVATAFAIEALGLVDHFQFLDRVQTTDGAPTKPPPASKSDAAVSAGWFLSTTGRWAQPYFDPNDLHSVDRLLFA